MRVEQESIDHEPRAPRPIITAPTAFRIVRKQIPISRSTFYRQIDSGVLQSSKAAGKILVRWQDMQAFIQQCKRPQC